MADISKIKLPDGTTYNLKDANASTTDEKLKVTSGELGSRSSCLYPILTEDNSTAETKKYNTAIKLYLYSSMPCLEIGDTLGGALRLVGPDGKGTVSLLYDGEIVNRAVYIPSKAGSHVTLATTDDIPQVYSSTNTGGYLTMATLPIYDGTVTTP